MSIIFEKKINQFNLCFKNYLLTCVVYLCMCVPVKARGQSPESVLLWVLRIKPVPLQLRLPIEPSCQPQLVVSAKVMIHTSSFKKDKLIVLNGF